MTSVLVIEKIYSMISTGNIFLPYNIFANRQISLDTSCRYWWQLWTWQSQVTALVFHLARHIVVDNLSTRPPPHYHCGKKTIFTCCTPQTWRITRETDFTVNPCVVWSSVLREINLKMVALPCEFRIIMSHIVKDVN